MTSENGPYPMTCHINGAYAYVHTHRRVDMDDVSQHLPATLTNTRHRKDKTHERQDT